MAIAKQDFLPNILASIILYATVLVYQGYQYGQGDQTQILPCLWAQDHPGAYAQDHYVQHYLSGGINERTIFHFLLRYLGYDQPWVVWMWHAISSIALILAWISIASVFIKNRALQWLCIGAILTLGFHTSTGSNEIYYNSFIPSLPAKALASWAIYYWLKEKYSLWVLLLILSGYLQPLVGMQVFLLTGAALFLDKWVIKINLQLPWKQIGFYLLASLPWFVLLALNNGSRTDPAAFMDIMEFRLSHHFFASYFGWVNLFLGVIFASICIWYYSGKMKWIFVAILTGCVVYEIGVEILRLPIALYTQWWKTTIWMEAFAFVAVFAQFEKSIFLNKIASRLLFILPITLFVLVCIYRLSGFFGTKPDYMFPWSMLHTDEVEISQLANQLTPEDAVFIIPPDLTAFRWYAKRSLFVDYKAMIHNETFLKDWYAKISSAYDYTIDSKKSGINFTHHANDILSKPSLNSIEKWKSIGINYIISPSADIVNLELIGGNKKYHIYRIP